MQGFLMTASSNVQQNKKLRRNKSLVSTHSQERKNGQRKNDNFGLFGKVSKFLFTNVPFDIGRKYVSMGFLSG